MMSPKTLLFLNSGTSGEEWQQATIVQQIQASVAEEPWGESAGFAKRPRFFGDACWFNPPAGAGGVRHGGLSEMDRTYMFRDTR
jgi:hypothetical protein